MQIELNLNEAILLYRFLDNLDPSLSLLYPVRHQLEEELYSRLTLEEMDRMHANQDVSGGLQR